MTKINRETIFFAQDIKALNVCGSTMYQVIGSDYTKPTEFIRKNYKHNLETCKQCAGGHASLAVQIGEQFKKFPMCCEQHRRLLKASWFNLKDFENYPKLYADKLYFTWHHILEYINEPDWKEEIFDYLEHIFVSFGSFPVDYGEAPYFKQFTEMLEAKITSLPNKARKNEILKFIGDYKKQRKSSHSDFNVLLETYDKWYRNFPFDLSFFAHLKKHFANNIPIVESFHTNKYLGVTKARMRTTPALVKLLVKITNTIIGEINTASLFEKGLVNNLDKVELELLVGQRKQQIKNGYHNESPDSATQYRRILKQWFKDEISFIKRIRPLFEKVSAKISEVHNSILRACGIMQGNKVYWDLDENSRTKQILDLVSGTFSTKDQAQYGESGTGKKPGSVDGVIIDKNEIEYFIEAVNVSGLNRDSVQKHINKLESNYDAKGLLTKYLLVYCNIADGVFDQFCKSYLDYLHTEAPFVFPLLGVEMVEMNQTNIQQIHSKHVREGKEVVLCHILIKMPEKGRKK